MQIVTKLSQVSREEQESWLGYPYAIDVETTGLDFVGDELIGVALHVIGKSYYFVLKHTADDGITINDYLSLHHLRMLLTPVMTQGEQVSCLHNSKYDLHFFTRYDMPLVSRNYDTLIAAQLLDENRSNGLKSLTHLVDVEHTKYEEFVKWTNFPKGCPLNVPLEPFAEYAMKDVIVTFKLWQLFRNQMAKEVYQGGRSLQFVFNNIWMPMIPVLQKMEARGFKIDRPYVQGLYDEYSKKVEGYAKQVRIEGLNMLARRAHDPESLPQYYWDKVRDEDEVYEDVDGVSVVDVEGVQLPVWQPTPRSMLRKLDFNLASNKQLMDLVYEHPLDLPEHVTLKLTKGGDDSVDVDNLTVIKHYLGDDTPTYIQAVLDWRKAEKFLNTYLSKFLLNADTNDRLHGMFNMAVSDHGRGGTHTGRLSSSQPNLQQIPSRQLIGEQARRAFITDENMQLIVADYSNMETVLMAHYSEDPMLLTAFAEGLDVHSLTASAQHNIPYDKFLEEYKNDNPQYDQWRRTAKTILFGTAYGMGPKKLQLKLLVDNGQEYEYHEVYEMLKSFDRTYEGLTKWKKDVIMYTRKTGYVLTMYGRKRRLPLAMHPEPKIRGRAERQAVNAIIQGTCADILFEAMPPIQAAFEGLGGGLIAAVHDELIGEVETKYADVAAKIMSTMMVDLVNPRLKCKLKAEAGIGTTWGDAKG